jgi:hypothetical protein
MAHLYANESAEAARVGAHWVMGKCSLATYNRSVPKRKFRYQLNASEYASLGASAP